MNHWLAAAPDAAGGVQRARLHGVAQRPGRPAAASVADGDGPRPRRPPRPHHRHAARAPRLGGAGDVRRDHRARCSAATCSPRSATVRRSSTTSTWSAPALEAEDAFGATCLTAATAPTIRRLADLEPRDARAHARPGVRRRLRGARCSTSPTPTSARCSSALAASGRGSMSARTASTDDDSYIRSTTFRRSTGPRPKPWPRPSRPGIAALLRAPRPRRTGRGRPTARCGTCGPWPATCVGMTETLHRAPQLMPRMRARRQGGRATVRWSTASPPCRSSRTPTSPTTS